MAHDHLDVHLDSVLADADHVGAVADAARLEVSEDTRAAEGNLAQLAHLGVFRVEAILESGRGEFHDTLI
jgi:hypothetical protein